MMLVTVIADACGCESPIVAGPMVNLGGVSITVSGVIKPLSKARAIVNGFMVEPGSKVSVITRLRMTEGSTPCRLFGLKVGILTIASTSPVFTSNTTIAPAFALNLSTACCSCVKARY